MWVNSLTNRTPVASDADAYYNVVWKIYSNSIFRFSPSEVINENRVLMYFPNIGCELVNLTTLWWENP